MTLADLTLLRPWWLLALAPLGLMWWRLWRAPEPGAASWRGLVDAHLLVHLLVSCGPRARRAGMALLALGLLLAVFALAGPARVLVQQPRLERDVTRVLVVDLSAGMAARLETVKLKLLALLPALSGGQTALLVYGGEPYLVVPPTTDVATIALFVPELAVDAIPVSGNRPERALRMATEILKRSAARQRDIVWVTAGAASDATQAPLAALAGLLADELAGTRLTILLAGGPDDPALAGAASRGAGALVRLRADDGDVRQLASTLTARSGWVAGPGVTSGATADLGYWLLLPLLALAALAFRRGILALLLGPMLLGGLLTPQPAAALELPPLAAMWADYQAWRLFQAGDPQAGAARFADPRWRAAAHYRAGQFEQAASVLAGASDADAHYNRGNALAKQARLADALGAYDAALKLRPLDPDTRYNRELVLRLLKQESEAPQRGGAPPAAARAPLAPVAPPTQGSTAEREAAQVADQWLRAIPDQPGSLLRRKLLAEQQRRQAGEAAR